MLTERDQQKKELLSQLREVLGDGPKYLSLQRVTVFMDPEHKELLEKIARQAMVSRPKKKYDPDRERITANTVVRALLDNLFDIASELNLEGIDNEDELRSRIQRASISTYSKLLMKE